MLLNRLEYALMNNPVRAALQRHFEARRLLALGGAMGGGRALEVGCGRGIGAELILGAFGADSVDAFDFDRTMVDKARVRHPPGDSRVRVWVGDAAAISVPDATYDAVFDFGILHHVHDWRRAVAEVHRVLKPGGRLYAEEVLKRGIAVSRHFLEHPRDDRFDAADFVRELESAGFEVTATRELWGFFAWFVARKSGRATAPG